MASRVVQDRRASVSVSRLWQNMDAQVDRFTIDHGARLLRISLGLIFIWFGALKATGRSPVAELVAHTIFWIPPKILVPGLGMFEIVLGAALLFGLAPRLAIPVFCLHLAGTFLVAVQQPNVTFQAGNPLLLTMTGEFIFKNLALIAGGLTVGGSYLHQSRRAPAKGMFILEAASDALGRQSTGRRALVDGVQPAERRPGVRDAGGGQASDQHLRFRSYASMKPLDAGADAALPGLLHVKPPRGPGRGRQAKYWQRTVATKVGLSNLEQSRNTAWVAFSALWGRLLGDTVAHS